MALWVLIAATLLLVAHLALAAGLLRQRSAERRVGRSEPAAFRPTVIVIVKDEERALPRLLESLARQSHQNFEMVFVDDGSIDGTAGLLETFQHRDPSRVQVIRGERRLDGRTAKQRRLDEAVAAARGDILLFTDADCAVPPRWVEDICNHFGSEEVGLVFGQLSVDSDGSWLQSQQAFDLPLLHHVAAGSAGLGVPTGGCGNNQAVRHRALEQVGGFCGLGYTLTEDVALVGAIRKAGWAVQVSTRSSTTTETLPQSEWHGLFQQRLRWAAGMWHASDWATRVAVRAYGLFCVLAVMAVLLSPVAAVLLWWPAALVGGLVSLGAVGAVMQRRASLRWLATAVFKAWGFVSMQALFASLLTVRAPALRWKGRKLELRLPVDDGSSSPAQGWANGHPRRAAFFAGAAASAGGLLVSWLAVLPSRWVLSDRATDEGTPFWLAFGSGFIGETALLCVPASLLVALCLLFSRRSRAVGRTAVGLAGLGLWGFMVAATESWLSRGVFPSWVDVGSRWQSMALVSGSAEMLLLPRNLVPALLMVVCGALLLRYWPKMAARHRALEISGALTTGAVFFVLLSWGFAPSVAPASASPLDIFRWHALPEARACLFSRCEPGALLDLAADSEAEARRGAAMLGWPGSSRAVQHPFERSLPSVESAAAPSFPAAGITDQLTALSEELLGSSDQPIHVWQLALEGVRGDDLHGVNPAAPRDAAPFIAELYDQAAAGTAGVIAATRAWTAGVRTPQGVGALLCGLGTLPYRLTLTRDLAGLPVRCLPDVLADAGYGLAYAYGGSADFDRLGPFLESHALAPQVSPQTLPADVPRGSWGASDRAVFSAAVARTPRHVSSYRLLISLSHHHPFVQPDDTPPSVLPRAERAFALASPRADHTDQRRLLTLAYTDEAVRELFESLERAGLRERSVVVITADHCIPERPLWRHRVGSLPLHQIRGLVPLVLWIAPQLFDRARDPARARRLAIALGHELRRLPLSQNDVPTLLLALLERHPTLSALPPERAWHSMGGQTTSPWYEAPGPPATRVHGFHAATALFFVDEQGEPTAPDEPAPLVVTPERARHVTPSLRPASAALRELRSARVSSR